MPRTGPSSHTHPDGQGAEMDRVNRVLYPKADLSLDDYVARGGLQGLAEALQMTPLEIIERVASSGLRGRGGAGFPTAKKWRTVYGNSKTGSRASVIVNGAEGEPGTFKDRTILRSNPYAVIEGAMIAAQGVGADHVVIALKKSFTQEVTRIREALDEVRSAGYGSGLDWLVFEGPDEYLYGEESAMLEAIDGRYPFPRIIPTYRVGLSKSERIGWPPPALVNNTETVANIPRIFAHGVDWFRRIGTQQSPGSFIATVTGATHRHGVAEFRMGATLREVIDTVGGGPRIGSVKAVLSGVSNPVIRGEHLDVLVSYEGLSAIGAGLGSAGFIVFDETTDMVAVAAGISRFLSVESCGQCTPCKFDGIDIAELLAKLSRSEGSQHDLDSIRAKVATVADGARCYLGVQQNQVLSSIIDAFGDEFSDHADRTVPGVEPMLIAELIDIRDATAVLDERHLQKQPDWTYNQRYSRTTPVDILSAKTPPWSSEK